MLLILLKDCYMFLLQVMLEQIILLGRQLMIQMCRCLLHQAIPCHHNVRRRGSRGHVDGGAGLFIESQVACPNLHFL